MRPSDIQGLLNSLTPAKYNFIQKLLCTKQGGGVGFLCRKTYSPSVVTSPDFRSFKSIILSCKSDLNNFAAACLYHPLGSCTTGFLENFLVLSGFLSSIGSSFIICGDINVHLDISLTCLTSMHQSSHAWQKINGQSGCLIHSAWCTL